MLQAHLKHRPRNIRDIAILKDYLVNDLGIPAKNITREPDRGTELRLMVEPLPQHN